MHCIMSGVPVMQDEVALNMQLVCLKLWHIFSVLETLDCNMVSGQSERFDDPSLPLIGGYHSCASFPY